MNKRYKYYKNNKVSLPDPYRAWTEIPYVTAHKIQGKIQRN